MVSSSLSTNQNKLRPSLIASAIEIMRNTNVSLYVHGATGIAKSAVARQVADHLGIAFIDERLSQKAPEDVRGIPMLGELHGMRGVIWQPPLSFPRDLDYEQTEEVSGVKTIRFFNPIGNNGIHYCTRPVISVEAVDPTIPATVIEQQQDRFTVACNGMVRWKVTGLAKAILALEEFNSAPPSVMAAAYQLVLDRRLGDYIVPSGVSLLAMGNRDGDKGVTYKLPKPVANRFIHLEMQVNFDDWLQWAINNDVHPDVIGYLIRWPSKLFDESFATSLSHSFATPRAWCFASDVVKGNAPKDVERALICGAVGDAIGNEFLLHRQFVEDMPDIRAIFNGDAPPFEPKNSQYKMQIGYSICVQLCYVMRDRNDEINRAYRSKFDRDKSPEQLALWEEADRAIGYIADNFQPEIALMFQRIALSTYKLRFNTSKMKRFMQFAEQYRDVVMAV